VRRAEGLRCGKRTAPAQTRPVRKLLAPPLLGVFLLAVLAFGPPSIDVGKTVLLTPRTKTSGCTLAANPDRRCLTRRLLREAEQSGDLLLQLPHQPGP
jgi:hypothetical protein